MEGEKVFIGIDVGKTSHYLIALDGTGEEIYHREVHQNEAEILHVLSEFNGFDEVLVAIDQPHNIGSLIVRCAKYLGYEVRFIPSKTMRSYAESHNIATKTDKIDAKVIATAAYKDPDILRKIADLDADKALLRSLKKRDRDLAYDRTKAINRLRAALLEDMPEFEAILKENRLDCTFTLELLKKFAGPWNMKAHIKAVENFCLRFTKKVPDGLVADLFNVLEHVHIKPIMADGLELITIPELIEDLYLIKKRRDAISAKINALLKNNEDYRILRTIPGVGEKLASQLVSEINIDEYASADDLASYAGIAPKKRESGTSINSKRSPRGGNKRLKDAFFMAARCSAQHSPISQMYYQKKRDQGKNYAMAHLALARRLCKIIYAMLKNKTPYEYRIPLIKAD